MRDRPRSPVFATMALAAVLVVAALALGLTAVRAALAFLPALNLHEPPLARVPPVHGPAPPRQAQRVILVMLDGLRLDTSFGRPFLDSLRDRGVDAQMRASFPSLSNPGFAAVLTGAPPADSGVRSNDYRTQVPLDSLPARARAAGLRVAYVSRTDASVPHMFANAIDSGGITPWPGGFDQAVRGALARGDELVLIWIPDIDTAGHEHGGDSPEYRAAARQVDAALARVLGDVDLTRDAIVVVADHGHVDGGGHGGVEPEVLDVPLVLAGAGVRPGATVVDAELPDVAPTVAALLGLPAPGHALGRTLTEALALPRDVELELRAADRARVAALDAALFDARADARLRAVRARATRSLPILGAILAIVAFAWFAARRGWAVFDRRVLLVAMPAFPLTFYSLLATFENWISPSMLPEAGTIPAKLFGYGAIAAVCHLAAAWVSLGGRPTPRDRLAAAAGMTVVGLCGALATVGLSWWFSVPALVRELPEPRLLMLVPAAYVAVALYAVSALITLAIEYTVFMARATRSLRV